MLRRRINITPQHAVLAARHGKHLLVEKPMALTLDGLRRHHRGGAARRAFIWSSATAIRSMRRWRGCAR